MVNAKGGIKAIKVSVLKGVAVANLMSAGFVFFYFGVLGRGSNNADGWNIQDTLSLVVFAIYMTLTSALAATTGANELAKVLGWLDDDRPPGDVELSATLAIPSTFARVSFGYWIGAAVVFGGLNAVFGNAVLYVVRIVIGILMGGLTSSALVYLLVERRLRSVFAAALTDNELQSLAGIRIARRLVLAWLVGSAIPLLAIVLAPLGRGTSEALSVRALVAVAAAGLAAGGVLTIGAARSVAAPLDRLREATRRLQDGDLTTTVTVDDGGEIGMLQSGFNRMVSGLQERDRLRELFGRYVGDDVAREAIDRDVRLGGELREVSVLFVDLIGSTALAEQRSPAAVVELLNRFFATVVREVGRENGWVNKFEGDGALCVFGAPMPQPDHALRALSAARALGLALRDVPDLDAAIGVSAGLVVAGNVGAEQRYEYTVIGGPVNEAARLTDLAKGRGVRALASEAVVTAAGPAEAACWRKVGALELRGRNRRTVSYEPAQDATALAARSTPASSTS